MRLLDWRRIGVGSAAGLGGLLVVAGLVRLAGLVVHGSAGANAERAISLLVLIAYWRAGILAVHSNVDFPATAAALAGLGAAALGEGVALAVWAVRGGALLRGVSAQHPAIVFVGPLMFGAIFGGLAGVWTTRHSSWVASTEIDRSGT